MVKPHFQFVRDDGQLARGPGSLDRLPGCLRRRRHWRRPGQPENPFAPDRHRFHDYWNVSRECVEEGGLGNLRSRFDNFQAFGRHG